MDEKQKALYSLIVDNGNDLIAIINNKFQYEYLNEKAHLNKLGYTKEDLIGKNRTDLIHPNDFKVGLELLEKGFKSDKYYQVEARFKHKDGHYVWLELRGRSFIDENGDKKGLLIARDITKSKEFELKLKELNEELEKRIEERSKELKDSEEMYRLITENSTDLIAIINKRNRYDFINEQSFQRILGYSKKDMIGKRTDKFLHPDDLNKLVKSLIKANFEGEGSLLARYKHKNGHYRWIETYGKMYKDSKGNSNALVIGRDMTEKLKAEQKLIESEEKFRTFTEQSIMGIGILQDEIFKYVNEAAANIIGCTKNEILNWGPEEFNKMVHPEDLKFLYEEIKNEEISKDTFNHYSFRIISKSGKVIWVDNYSKNIKFEGKPAKLLTVIDTTEKIENKLKLQESEFKYRVAFDKAEFYKDLLAHDFGNIFQNILATAELALSYLNDPYKAKEKLIGIMKLVEKAGRLNSNIRILSEIDKKKTNLKSINVKEYLDSSIIFVKNSYSRKKISVNEDYLIENPHVQADELLHDVFENVLINAIQHNNNKKIIIEVRISKIQKNRIGFIKIEFIDNGTGIHNDMKKDIFNRGFRENKSVRGMGIGLSLLKKIMISYDGEIYVEDKVPGDYIQGSNFILLFKEG